MRFLVAGAIYLAKGALFSTIDTVAGENPLCVATSLIVTASFFSRGRFTRRAPWRPTSSRLIHSLCNVSVRSCRGALWFILRNEGRLPAALAAENLFRRHFKRQRLPEPPRLPNTENNPRDHPDASNDLRR